MKVIKCWELLKKAIPPDEEEKGHPCPYRIEMRGDYDTLCHCDEYATKQCALDI